jgi:hypothetical protein
MPSSTPEYATLPRYTALQIRAEEVVNVGTESLVAAAVQWAERIMRKIDGVFPK